ncbi:MAG: molybdopterin molybdotransferase MoeA [Planctomycetes bacterium]|nr:molybdopterin molybdotransferase MoeA [Planctomycetota bacterium]
MAPLPTYNEALNAALTNTVKVSTIESVDLASAARRILAEDIVADRDLPPFNRSQMDGYAVVASEVKSGVKMRVVGEVAAGATFEGEYAPNTCVSIATGAPVPDCFDAVVQHELTDKGSDVVEFHCDDVKQGKSIHKQGVDAKAEDVLVAEHIKLAPQHIGIAASVGLHEIKVLSKPKVVVITSGDEVIPPEETPLPHQIRNGNNAMVAAVFATLGCDVVDSHHVLDDPEATEAAIAKSLDGHCDLVVTIGGVSAGKRDFFPATFANSGIELAVKGANIQPGKPVIVGKHTNAVVLGLPGNPVSALVCCCVFGWPIVRKLQGISPELPWQNAPLATNVQPNPNRRCFRPCQLVDGTVAVPTWQGSGDLVHTATTHGLVQLPPSTIELREGEPVSCIAYPWV